MQGYADAYVLVNIFKALNYNHLMPTRYALELEGLKGVVSGETFKEVGINSRPTMSTNYSNVPSQSGRTTKGSEKDSAQAF